MASTEPKTTDVVAANDYSAEIEALIASQEEDLASSTGGLTAPIIKLTQSMTQEVKTGDVEAGDFFNTLTGESYGPAIEFIICDYAEGRALSGKGGVYRTAINQDEIPETWVGVGPITDADVGTRFDEHPDAYETYSERVNTGELAEWGSGPRIATTFNYTGLVVLTDSETDEVTLMPGRITLQRSTKDAHKKISLLKTNLLRGKPFWDITFALESEEKSSGNNDYFGIKVKKGRNTTQKEKLRATELAFQNRSGAVADNADRDKSESETVEPKQSGKGVAL